MQSGPSDAKKTPIDKEVDSNGDTELLRLCKDLQLNRSKNRENDFKRAQEIIEQADEKYINTQNGNNDTALLFLTRMYLEKPDPDLKKPDQNRWELKLIQSLCQRGADPKLESEDIDTHIDLVSPEVRVSPHYLLEYKCNVPEYKHVPFYRNLYDLFDTARSKYLERIKDEKESQKEAEQEQHSARSGEMVYIRSPFWNLEDNVQVLCRSLQQNQHITHLSLRLNLLTVLTIIHAIRNHPSLKGIEIMVFEHQAKDLPTAIPRWKDELRELKHVNSFSLRTNKFSTDLINPTCDALSEMKSIEQAMFYNIHESNIQHLILLKLKNLKLIMSNDELLKKLLPGLQVEFLSIVDHDRTIRISFMDNATKNFSQNLLPSIATNFHLKEIKINQEISESIQSVLNANQSDLKEINGLNTMLLRLASSEEKFTLPLPRELILLTASYTDPFPFGIKRIATIIGKTLPPEVRETITIEVVDELPRDETKADEKRHPSATATATSAPSTALERRPGIKLTETEPGMILFYRSLLFNAASNREEYKPYNTRYPIEKRNGAFYVTLAHELRPILYPMDDQNDFKAFACNVINQKQCEIIARFVDEKLASIKNLPEQQIITLLNIVKDPNRSAIEKKAAVRDEKLRASPPPQEHIERFIDVMDTALFRNPMMHQTLALAQHNTGNTWPITCLAARNQMIAAIDHQIKNYQTRLEIRHQCQNQPVVRINPVWREHQDLLLQTLKSNPNLEQVFCQLSPYSPEIYPRNSLSDYTLTRTQNLVHGLLHLNLQHLYLSDDAKEQFLDIDSKKDQKVICKFDEYHSAEKDILMGLRRSDAPKKLIYKATPSEPGRNLGPIPNIVSLSLLKSPRQSPYLYDFEEYLMACKTLRQFECPDIHPNMMAALAGNPYLTEINGQCSAASDQPLLDAILQANRADAEAKFTDEQRFQNVTRLFLQMFPEEYRNLISCTPTKMYERRADALSLKSENAVVNAVLQDNHFIPDLFITRVLGNAPRYYARDIDNFCYNETINTSVARLLLYPLTSNQFLEYQQRFRDYLKKYLEKTEPLIKVAEQKDAATPPALLSIWLDFNSGKESSYEFAGDLELAIPRLRNDLKKRVSDKIATNLYENLKNNPPISPLTATLK